MLNTFVFAQEKIPTEDLPEIDLTMKSPFGYEKAPVFPEGAKEFRNILFKNFRPEKFSGSSDIHCDLIFVVNKEGIISEVKAIGINEEFNNEAVYAISQIKQKWIPGTLNDIPVNYRMKVPLDLKFEKETIAKFPEGDENFKKIIAENLIVKNYLVKKSCIISFLVDNTGKMRKISVRGEDRKFNKDVKQSASKIKDVWLPKTIRDIPVSSFVEVIFELN